MFKFLISFLILPLLLTINFAYSKPSVFSIKDKGKGTKGTAFYIGEGQFVTNFHIVETDQQSFYSIDSLGSNRHKVIEAKIIHLDAKNDLAVLQVDLEFIQTLEESMTPLILSEAPNLIKNSKYKTVAIDYYNYDEETRVQHDIGFNNFHKDLEDSKMQFYSIKIKGGMSGSPILDAENQVIGILCRANSIKGFATPVAKLLALLKTPQLECESFLECIKQEINGNAVAQFELAKKYTSGKEGAPQDFKQAAYWFKKAATQGNKQAKKALQEIGSEKIELEKRIVEKLLKTIPAAL